MYIRVAGACPTSTLVLPNKLKILSQSPISHLNAPPGGQSDGLLDARRDLAQHQDAQEAAPFLLVPDALGFLAVNTPDLRQQALAQFVISVQDVIQMCGQIAEGKAFTWGCRQAASALACTCAWSTWGRPVRLSGAR